VATSASSGFQNFANAQQQAFAPDVVQKGGGARWVQFKPHTIGALYSAMVARPSGDVWFIDENAPALAHIDQAGATGEFTLKGATGNVVSMTAGADGKFYIGDESANVLVATAAGKVDVVPIPSGDTTSIDGLALGPDGNVWFTEFNHIAKITPSQKVTEYPYPSGDGTNQYGGVTAGSDGNVWFADSSANAIGRIVPSTGNITMFPITPFCIPSPVVLAKDNNVWFACLTSAPLFGRIDPQGNISTYPIGGTFNSNETEQFCTRGPDGEPWCASGNDGTLFRVDTATQTVTTYAPPLPAGARPDAVVAGPDGNLWVDTVGGVIDVFAVDPLKVTPAKIAFTAAGQSATVSVSEKGATSWTATSSNASLATVTQGASKSSFVITAVAAGTCKITISDGAGNSTNVSITIS